MKFKLKNVVILLKKKLFSLHLIKIILQNIEDICILGGLYFIIKATFLLSKIAGFYALGICLVLIGIWFARNPIGKE